MKNLKNVMIILFGLFFVILAIASSNNLAELLKPRRGAGSWGSTNFLILGILGLIMVFLGIRNIIKGDN